MLSYLIYFKNMNEALLSRQIRPSFLQIANNHNWNEINEKIYDSGEYIAKITCLTSYMFKSCSN